MSDPIEIVCLGCGCLCDDYPARVVNGRVRPADATCSKGATWLAAAFQDAHEPAITYRGQPIGPDEAVERAAELLRASRSPWIVGLTGSTVEAVREAAALADRLGATIERGDAIDAFHEVAATQEVGRITATLGEVRDRADLVVFWGVDPDTTHPRHGERFSIDPIGRFIPNGRNDRTILVAGQLPNATAQRADGFWEITPATEFQSIQALRGLVRGEPSNDLVPIRWAEAFQQARYVAIFHGESLGDGAALESLHLLVRDLNESRRAVLLAMGGPGNPSGASAVLTWQGGDPLGVDYSAGFPRSARARLRDRLFGVGQPYDLALVVDGDRHPQVPASLPTIQIGPGATRIDPPPTLAINAARPGIDGEGTVVRVDGAWLSLVPPLPARHPTDREWLRRIRLRLDLDEPAT